MLLKPSDLSNAAYDCHIIMETLKGEAVLILKKKTDSPMNWCVMQKFSTCFFATRKEAIDFCEKHDCGIPKPPRGGIKIAKNDSSADRLAAVQTKTHIQTWY